ncbi:hypothetical protein AALO_G00004960 [Alosa alosa]|uniref:Immunoglobulin V-set domain-containing protein n=1 Tax=Alosa alosa TaxID=278164 RepID=A0AAV6HHM8_9TELE|nr:hypothetical protein AALO_G00004960 [Alosa alosa]
MGKPLLLILIIITEIIADSIDPDRDRVSHPEGMKTVTLKCSYQTSSRDVYLYWYRQYPHQAPQWLLYKAYHCIEEDAGNNRLVEHPEELAAHIEGPQPPHIQVVHPPSFGIDSIQNQLLSILSVFTLRGKIKQQMWTLTCLGE